VDFLGFHVVAGSQILHADLLCEAQRKAGSSCSTSQETRRCPSVI
jgi:hypothetical protein